MLGKEKNTQIKPVSIDSDALVEQDFAENPEQGKVWFTLGRKLFIAFLLLSLVPIFAISVISYQDSRKSLQAQSFNTLRTTTRSREIGVILYLRGKMARILDFSSDVFIADSLLRINQKNKSAGRLSEALNEHLSNKHNLDPEIYETLILDLDGRIVAATNRSIIGENKSNEDYFIEGKKGAYIKDVYRSTNMRGVGFAVSSPINSRKTAEFIGVVVNRYAMDGLNEITTDIEGMGQTGEVYIVNKEGYLITKSIFLKDVVLKQKVNTKPVRLFHSQGEEMYGVYPGYRDVLIVGASGGDQLNKEFGLGWLILAEIGEAEAFKSVYKLRNILVSVFISITLIVLVVTIFITKHAVNPIKKLSTWTSKVAEGDLDTVIAIESNDEIGQLAGSFENMIVRLKSVAVEREKQDWLKTGQAELSDNMRGNQDVFGLAQNIISYLVPYLNAQLGAVYLVDEDNILRLAGSYAYTKRKNLSNEFKFGEGLVGEAALEKQSILVTNVPDDYARVSSGLGEAVPHNILVVPFIFSGMVKGVLEIGAFGNFTDIRIDLVNMLAEQIAIAFHTAQANSRTKELLEKTQTQAEELQVQQQELKAANEELEEQTQVLKESEAKLQAQQEELQATNEELEERSEALEGQKKRIQDKNEELQKAQEALKEKAQQLELTSKYKSEFLANMSHELRTPLNSLLILSKQLAGNKAGNLTGKQVEYANTINSSGYDLLGLINDILDLSKVEAGKMQLHVEKIELATLPATIRQSIMPLIQKKNLGFDIELSQDLPLSIHTDLQRVNQIIKNLLSNAIKFTHEGGITVSIHRPRPEADLSGSELEPQKTIAISVTDTGVGIPADKQRLIFEAFHQADGSTSRKYGGTGLGLSFSRELAKFLSGVIRLRSEEGRGSTFTLYLPESISAKLESEPAQEPEEISPPPVGQSAKTSPVEQPVKAAFTSKSPTDIETIPDDRKDLQSEDKSLLIVEDDPKFAKILLDLAHEKGFKCLIAGDGETGLQFADYYKPKAIILDISLPGIDGWEVMERLKANPDTRNIPVHFMSASEKDIRAMRMGAIGYLAKPVELEMLEAAFKKMEDIISQEVKKLLVVDDDDEHKGSILTLVDGPDVDVHLVSNGREAYEQLKSKKFDSIVLNPQLADKSGWELLDQIKEDKDISSIPIIIYSNKNLSKAEEATLREHAGAIIIKEVSSLNKLFDEVVLFLHLIEANLPQAQQNMLKMVHDKEAVLNGKKILLVDDDARNVFALSSVLEEKGITILMGKNGKEGLKRLEENPDIDLVLMDIMMPEMDGYEAIAHIREQEKFKDLPVIALTAKAMKGDRAKCIEAGANDYLAKPVDTERLLSLLRVWLYKGVGR